MTAIPPEIIKSKASILAHAQTLDPEKSTRIPVIDEDSGTTSVDDGTGDQSITDSSDDSIDDKDIDNKINETNYDNHTGTPTDYGVTLPPNMKNEETQTEPEYL